MAEPGKGRRDAGQVSGSAPDARSPSCWLSPPPGCCRSARKTPSSWPSASGEGEKKDISGPVLHAAEALTSSSSPKEPGCRGMGSSETAADSNPSASHRHLGYPKTESGFQPGTGVRIPELLLRLAPTRSPAGSLRKRAGTEEAAEPHRPRAPTAGSSWDGEGPGCDRYRAFKFLLRAAGHRPAGQDGCFTP